MIAMTVFSRSRSLRLLGVFVLGCLYGLLRVGTVPAFADTPPADSNVPPCHGQPATIVGTSGADNIVGTPGNDVIVARGGNDVVSGRGGNDVICAEEVTTR